MINNVVWQNYQVTKRDRANIMGHNSSVLWFTGLSGSGKSTISNLVEKKLNENDIHTYVLDGDNIRHGLGSDLNFSDIDRKENIRRIAHVAKLMSDAGLVVLVSFISPFKEDRAFARNLHDKGDFMEIFIDCDLSECEARDPKGNYKKARAGEIKSFTGIDSPYEKPPNPDLAIDSYGLSPEQAAEMIICNLPLEVSERHLQYNI